jgi:hypothetical protein
MLSAMKESVSSADANRTTCEDSVHQESTNPSSNMGIVENFRIRVVGW